MNSASKIEGRKLVIPRMAGAAMVIACANDAYTGYITGAIKVGTRRNSLIMTDENLWLGYLFLLSTTAISFLFLFANKGHTKAFKNYAKFFGGIWFVTLGACIAANLNVR